MFEHKPELASDLEWMMQSGQVSKELLLETLVEQFYQPIFHFSLAFLDSQTAAQRATLLALANTIAEQYNYRDHIGVNAWVYGFALETCTAMLEGERLGQAQSGREKGQQGGLAKKQPNDKTEAAIWEGVDEVNNPARAALILHTLAGLDINDITKILKVELVQATRLLESARNSLAARLENAAGINTQDPQQLDSIIRESLIRRWPAVELSQPAIKTHIKKIAALAGRRSARKFGISRYKEMAITGIIILMIAGMTWGANKLWPEPEVGANNPPTELVTKIVYVTRWVDPTATPTPTATPIPKEIFYSVQPGDTLESVAAALMIDIDSLRSLNRIPVDAGIQAGQELLIPGPSVSTPPPATRVPAARRVQPLEAPYTSLEILQRLKLGDDLFNTLWFDTVMVDYGPAAYIGPVRMRRVQVWLSLNQVLVVIGLPDNQIEEVWLMQGENLYMANPSAKQPWFLEAHWSSDAALSSDAGQSSSAALYGGLERLFATILGNNDPLVAGDTLSAIERAEWAGQQVLIVDEINYAGQRQARLWMDDRTGLVLRKQWYSTEDESILTQELSLLGIAYDIDFPQELFDTRLPWRGGFAADGSGRPAGDSETTGIPTRPQLMDEPPPQGYDPGKGNLIFEYYSNELENRNPVKLFADNYLLGTISFGNPWQMICQRSPNGERIAYVNQPSLSNIQPSPLDWMSLDSQHLDHQIYWFNIADLPGPSGFVLAQPITLDVASFAWAPDSRRLAVFGYKPNATSGALYIVDTDRLEVDKLIDLDSANSLAWRQDGKRVALIARFYSDSYEEHILILDVENGGLINAIPIDIQNGTSKEWPFENWDTDFPVQMGGLQACASAIIEPDG